MIPRHSQAKCEWCGGIVSRSRAKGDTSDPIDTRNESTAARYWHSECAIAEQEAYVSTRFHRTPEELAAEGERCKWKGCTLHHIHNGPHRFETEGEVRK